MSARSVVLAGPVAAKPHAANLARPALLQRKCQCGAAGGLQGECEDCKKKKVQRKGAGSATSPASVPPIVHDVLKSPGQPLDAGTRSFFEPRFGHDFSRVRVHADGKAAESACAVNAVAYTVGRDVVFNAGQFAPASAAGRHLLAHELTHVVQQSRTGSQRSPGGALEIGPAADAAERQAESVARAMAVPEGAARFLPTSPPLNAGQARLQRQGGSGDDPAKTPKPWIPLGDDWSLDPKVTTPLGSGSLEDIHKGLDALRHKDQPVDIPCAPGWLKMQDGRCCEGKRDGGGQSVNLTKCCSPAQLTKMGVCCKPDETAEDWGCKKNPPPPVPGNSQQTPGSTGQAAPQAQVPGFLSGPIHFGTIESETYDNFALNGPQVPAGNEKRLDHMAALLNIYREVDVHIEGHTDGSGTEAINKPLSLARAEALKAQLVKRGVKNPGRLKTDGFSATQPVVPPQTPDAQEPKNRRVEVWFHILPAGDKAGAKGTP